MQLLRLPEFRKLTLVDWQLATTHQYTREFVRGLIHSDGSRCINRFSVKLPTGRVGALRVPAQHLYLAPDPASSGSTPS
jgi:hypothetical protein